MRSGLPVVDAIVLFNQGPPTSATTPEWLRSRRTYQYYVNGRTHGVMSPNMLDEHMLDSYVVQYVYTHLTSIIHSGWSQYRTEAINLPAPLGHCLTPVETPEQQSELSGIVHNIIRRRVSERLSQLAS
jgi:hypothetical protein